MRSDRLRSLSQGYGPAAPDRRPPSSASGSITTALARSIPRRRTVECVARVESGRKENATWPRKLKGVPKNPAVLASDRLVAAFNGQIGNEMHASLQYASIAAHFDAENLPQLAAFFYRQATEERQHALKFVRFVVDVGGRVEIPAIAKPRRRLRLGGRRGAALARLGADGDGADLRPGGDREGATATTSRCASSTGSSPSSSRR